MHITTEEMSTEKRKPERDKDNKLSLNIANREKSEVSTKSIMRESRTSLLGRKYNSLEQSIGMLRLSDDESEDSDSSDEETRKNLESILVPKCPDRIKTVSKEQKRAQTRPYQFQVSQHISPCLQSGGGVVPTYLNDWQSNTCQIPLPVVEYEAQNEAVSPQELREVMAKLNDDQIQLLNKAIDEAAQLLKEKDKERFNSIPPSQTRMRDVDSCNSPDSSYGTMSPASIPPSPFSMHSPNPRIEKRLSESDSSAGECELAATEQPFGPLDIRLQPVQMQNCIYVPPPPRLVPVSTPTVCPAYSPPHTQLFPRPLRPDSIDVNEVGLEKSAVTRMKERKLLKTSNVGIQWVAAIQEAQELQVSEKNKAVEKQNILRRMLIDLIREGPSQNPTFYEMLYCRVKLYMKDAIYKEILTGKDPTSGQTPLLAAVIFRNDTPLVARLLVDILDADHRPVAPLDGEGNSILHYLATRGDKYGQVLCELLYSKAFNVNHKNAGSKTALHKAVETHAKISSLASIKLLVKHGALVRIQDLYGRTVLHLAVTHPQSDPQVLRALLATTDNEAVNIVDNDRNTPLHIAAQRNDLSLERQKEFISLLMMSKARHDVRNKDEKVALSLVSQERKEDIKNIMHRRM